MTYTRFCVIMTSILCVGWIAWFLLVYDPPPNIPSRIGPDGGPAPLTEDEFRRLLDWMRRNRDKL